MKQFHEQIEEEEKYQLQLKQRHWQKWLQWLNEVRKQRFTAVKVFQFQNVIEEKLIQNAFKKWVEFTEESKFQKLLKLKNSMVQQGQQNSFYEQFQSNDQSQFLENHQQDLFKANLAHRFQERKTYFKFMRALISYRISCKRFQQNLSKIYLKFILRKYFDIVNDYRIRSKQKKNRKEQIFIQNFTQKQDTNNLNPQSQINFVDSSDFIEKNDKFIKTAQNFSPFNQASIFKRSQPHTGPNPQEIITYNFYKNLTLGQSRRSEFLSISSQLNYESKRKFKPITELPFLPDFESDSQKFIQDSKQNQAEVKKIPEKTYQSDPQQIPKSPDFDEKQTQIQSFDKEKNIAKIILSLLVKQKIISLSILSGDEFQEGMQYENYREKTVHTLKKMRDIKIK